MRDLLNTLAAIGAAKATSLRCATPMGDRPNSSDVSRLRAPIRAASARCVPFGGSRKLTPHPSERGDEAALKPLGHRYAVDQSTISRLKARTLPRSNADRSHNVRPSPRKGAGFGFVEWSAKSRRFRP